MGETETYDQEFLNNLSVRAKNICLRNNIYNLRTLFEFTQSGGKLRMLRNCGPYTVREFEDILYENANSNESSFNDTNIAVQEILEDDLKKKFLVDFFRPILNNQSVRTTNAIHSICKPQDINVISFIEKSVLHYFDYKKVPSAGAKTFKELNSLKQEIIKKCQELKTIEIDEQNLILLQLEQARGIKVLNDTNIAIQEILEDDLKKKFLVEFFRPILNNQSVRTTNAIHSICKPQDINVISFIEKSVLHYFDYKKVPSAGAKTFKELNSLKQEIIKKCQELKTIEIDEQNLILLQLEQALVKNLNEDAILIKFIKTKSINLVWFFDNYILDSCLFNEIEKDILLNRLAGERTPHSISTYDLIGEKHSLTKERVRQISKKLFDSLANKINSIRIILDYSFDISTTIKDCKYWKVSLQPFSEHTELEYLQNDVKTMTEVISYFINNEYYTISNQDKLPSYSEVFNRDFYNGYRNLKIFYVIKSSFISKRNLIEYITECYHTNIERFESDFYFEPSFVSESDNELKDFIGVLVSENFNIPYENDKLLIKRNTLKGLPEIIKEILIDNDSPMTIDEIFTELGQLYPGKCKSTNAMRGSLQKAGIVYYRGIESSGASRYGLSEWEETKGLKSGTIKELCYEYLQSKSEPVHSLELWRYIAKYRDTTQKNILVNIQLDPQKRFTTYKGGFLGLAEKNYDRSLTNKFKNFAATQVQAISYFIKNHVYYNQSALIDKFSKEFDVFKIQINHVIDIKCEEGVFKVVGDRVYYNSIEEDSILNNLFKNENSIIKGLNPYKCEWEDKKLLIRVGLSKTLEYVLSEIDFEFHKHDYNFSKFRLSIIYNSSIKVYKAILWLDDVQNELIHTNITFNAFEDYSIESKGHTSHLITFSQENSGKFLAMLKVLLTTDYKIKKLSIGENEIDFNLFDLSNKSKLESYSIITNLVKEKYDVELQLTEAKKIYNRLVAYGN